MVGCNCQKMGTCARCRRDERMKYRALIKELEDKVDTYSLEAHIATTKLRAAQRALAAAFNYCEQAFGGLP